MITTIRRLCTILFFFSFFIHAGAQELRTFNQNSSRSNHTHALSISLSPVYSSSVNGNRDSLLFRGSGGGFRVGADYFLGNAGISFSSGFGSSSPNNTAINNFLKNSPIPPDQFIISKSNQQNMYLLLGPSVHFGNTVQLYAHAKGGLFINNSGLISIQQKGAVRAAYRNESTGKSIYPGFQTGLSFQYKGKSDVWSFGIGADYMSTKTEVTNYDARRGGGVEGLKLSQNIKDIVAGISIRYNIFSPRDHSSGQSTGRRVLPTVNKREISSPRDAASGLATGKRLLPTVNKKEITIDESGGLNSTGSCGPVTKKITNGDGSTEEMTFSCPADALAYERQTPKTDFGDKLNTSDKTNELKKTFAAPHVFEQKGIISGTLTWGSSNNGGIISNAVISNSSPRSGSATMNSQTSSTRTTNQSSFGTMVRLSAREAGSGMATGRRAREAGSGLATGRRQYEPIFAEGQGDVCNPCLATAKMSAANNNPLYNDNGMSGTNPFYDKRTADNDCDGVSGADIYLINTESNEVAAKTKTEQCGDFFFANVPEGNYVVRVSAVFGSKKGYDIYLKSKTDLLGDVTQSDDWMQLTINTSTEDNVQKAGISTSRSNIRTKSISVIEADLDGDGEYESLRATGILSDGSTRDITSDAKRSISNAPGTKGIVLGESALSMRRRVEVLKSNKQGDPGAKTITGIKILNTATAMRAIAILSDGSTKDVTEALTTNTANDNVKQYSIMIADLDGDGTADAVVKTKTKSNQSNDRMANGDLEDDGIWSPRSNIKMIRVAAGDVDGDGTADLAAGNLRTEFAILRDRNKTYFETGDKPTQEQRTVGGLVPGGAIISAAMRPGNPIGGLTIKGGKNPGGNLRTVQTNEDGKFEFNNLEAGDYTFTIEQRLVLDDETPVTVGGDAAKNINTSESNLKDIASPKKGDVKATASQNSQSLRTIKQDVNPDIDEIKNDNSNNNPVTKAQNNNTVRSNRTGNALIDLSDNSDSNDIAIDEGGQSKPKGKSNPGPVKWMAPEAMKAAINTSHSNIKNLLASLDQLDGQLNSDHSNAKSIVNTSRSNIKNQRAAINDLEETLGNLQAKDKDDAINELDQRMAAMNMQFLSLQESLAKLGRQYTTISNVLKTRHDIAMNSIRNMK